MLQQPTKEKLYALKLQGMIEAIERQEQDEAARELGFLDRLALVIDQQWSSRQNQALTRRVKASRLRGAACVEDIEYRAERGLSKSVIRGLAQESGWVMNHEHIFALGPTGVGKSYVVSALAQKACRDDYSVYYTRTAALFRDLSMARADGSLRQLLFPQLRRRPQLSPDDRDHFLQNLPASVASLR
jgi:DNA replication protein DnaC